MKKAIFFRNKFKRFIIFVVTGFFCVILTEGLCHSATYYIDPASGSDTASGSASAPWKSLKKAISSTVPGDIVMLRDGYHGDFSANNLPEYTGSFEDPLPSSAKYITFKSVNRNNAVMGRIDIGRDNFDSPLGYARFKFEGIKLEYDDVASVSERDIWYDAELARPTDFTPSVTGTCDFSGYIIDSKTGLPVIGAFVTLYDSNHQEVDWCSSFNDEHYQVDPMDHLRGRYRFDYILTGKNYTVECTNTGYKKFTSESISIGSDKNTVIFDILLEPLEGDSSADVQNPPSSGNDSIQGSVEAQDDSGTYLEEVVVFLYENGVLREIQLAGSSYDFKKLSRLNNYRIETKEYIGYKATQSGWADLEFSGPYVLSDVSIENCVGVQFKDCKFFGANFNERIGFEIKDANDISIQDCIITDYFRGLSCHTANNINIIKTEIKNICEDFILIKVADNINIDGNHIHSRSAKSTRNMAWAHENIGEWMPYQAGSNTVSFPDPWSRMIYATSMTNMKVTRNWMHDTDGRAAEFGGAFLNGHGMGNLLFENNLLYKIDGNSTLRTSALYLKMNSAMSDLVIRNNTFVSYKWPGIVNLGRVLFYTQLFGAKCVNNLFLCTYEMDGNFYMSSKNNHNIYIKPETEDWLNWHVKITSPSCPLDEYNILGCRDFNVFPTYEDVLTEWPDAVLWYVPGEDEPYSYGYDWWEEPLHELFVDFTNYKFELKSGSKAIGFADPLDSPDIDVLGRQRDSRPDAGCFEYGAVGGDIPWWYTPGGGIGDEQGTILLGDIDENGSIDAYDASMAARSAAQLIQLTALQLTAADGNRDGIITAVDAAAIARYAAGFTDSQFSVGQYVGDGGTGDGTDYGDFDDWDWGDQGDGTDWSDWSGW